MPCHELLFTDKYGRYAAEDLNPQAHTVQPAELGRFGFALAVEDAPETADFLATELQIPVLLLDRPWNADHRFGDGAVRRCRDWEEVAGVVASGFPTA